MLHLDDTTLTAVAEKSAQDAAAHPRWLNAIGRALVELAENPYLERGDHGLIIGSPSGNCYAANGVCQCCAYTGIDPQTGERLHKGKQPCWHRAAARLVRLHDEAQTAQFNAKLATARRNAYDKAVREMDALYA